MTLQEEWHDKYTHTPRRACNLLDIPVERWAAAQVVYGLRAATLKLARKYQELVAHHG